jgi:hypothetical protein
VRPLLVTLVLGVVLLPGAQHGVADLIDPQHGLHGHCHHAYEAHPDEAHEHEGHAHSDEHHADEHHADEGHAHHAHEGHAHEGHALGAHEDADAHTRVVMPLPCSAPDHDEPCPHAPLDGGHHHSHAMPPMLITSAPSALAVWSAPRHFAYGVRSLHLHGRASPRSLDRPPRA